MSTPQARYQARRRAEWKIAGRCPSCGKSLAVRTITQDGEVIESRALGGCAKHYDKRRKVSGSSGNR